MTLTNAPEPTQALPRLARDYDVQVRLGEGGFGEVYAGWDKRLQRSVALKFLRGGSEAQRENHRETLLREARLAASLRHPALAAVYDVVMEDDAAVIVMERVFGQTLKQRIAQQPPTLGETLRILHQTASALAHLHRHGLAHGDIKLSNLMLDAEGQLRVLDFGLARLVDAPNTAASTKPSHILGTPAFMAPERRAGSPPTLTSDVYSLGVVGQMLLEAAIAAGSFDATGPAGAVARRELDELLLKMTRRQPEQRPATMVQVAAALQRILAPASETTKVQPQAFTDAPTEATPTSVAVTGRRPRGKQFAVAAIVATLVLAVVAWKTLAPRDSVAPETPAVAPAPVAVEATPARLAQAERLLLDFDQDNAIKEAIELLEPAIVPGKPNAPVASLLALAYCVRYVNDERDPLWLQRAKANAELAMEADNQYALAQVAQAWVLEYTGDYAKAAEHYAAALALQPDNLWLVLGRARMATAQVRYQEAEALVAEALARHPRERLVWDTSGTLHFRKGDYLAAESDFRQSMELRPDSASAYSNLAAALLHSGRSEEAMKVLQRGLEIRPHGRLYSVLGSTLYTRGRYAEAVAAFEAAVSSARGSPNDELRWANLAGALRHVPGRETEATNAYARALQLLEPQLEAGDASPDRLGRAALYAARLGRVRQAQDYLDRSLEVAGDGSANTWYRALLVAESLGWRERAFTFLERALERGYSVSMLEQDPDLVSLRRDARYHATLSRRPR